MEVLEYSRLLILIFGAIAGIVIGFFFSRTLKSSEVAKRSWTIIMAIATALIAAISLIITWLNWKG